MADFAPETSADGDALQDPWKDLDTILNIECSSHELIDDALRSWLELSSAFRRNSANPQNDIFVCSARLLECPIFSQNKEYVRTQIIYSLLQEDEGDALYAISSFLLLHGRTDDSLFRCMIDASCFSRLQDMIHNHKEDDPLLHQLLLELMYEMSRMERLRTEDLLHVDDEFVAHLLHLIEYTPDEAGNYHYPIIRVLLVLNEQYMLASTVSTADPMSPTAPLTNRVVKQLSLHGLSFRTFGENIILLLNRETETSQQLLILKLLYLLFTTKATYEYFYTNDLKVLVDIIIRNLMDLPDEKMSLRHTYLRVLYPLLAHTQLSQPPHYKKGEVTRVLRVLGGMGNVHFAPADETTVRLVERVSNVKWLMDMTRKPSDVGEQVVANRFLGISLVESQTASAASVVDVAAVMEKPGVQTPSRKAAIDVEINDVTALSRIDTTSSTGSEMQDGLEIPPKTARVLPVVPKHRHGVPLRAALHLAPKKTPPKAPPPRRKAKLRTVQSPVDQTSPTST